MKSDLDGLAAREAAEVTNNARAKDPRFIECLKRIGKILQNKFNVFIRLRAFSIQDASITALDLEN